MFGVNYPERLRFVESKEVKAIIKRLARREGQREGAFLRMAVRNYLRTRNDLTEEDKQVLGIGDNAIAKAPSKPSLSSLVQELESKKPDSNLPQRYSLDPSRVEANKATVVS